MHRTISPKARYKKGCSMYFSYCSDSIVLTLLTLLKIRYAKNPSPASRPTMVTMTINLEITFISTWNTSVKTIVMESWMISCFQFASISKIIDPRGCINA